MTNADLYLERAAEARRDAEAATLSNVRERCLRSEEAWLTMARRVNKLAAMQEVNEAAKAEAAEARQVEAA
jgi:hypothetical protein